MAVVGSCMCMVYGYMYILAAIKELLCLGVGCHELCNIDELTIKSCLCDELHCVNFVGHVSTEE